MKRIFVPFMALMLTLVPVLSALAVNPSTSPTPSPPKTPLAPAGSDSAFAAGQIERIEPGNPTVFTITRLTGGSVNIRPLKVNGTLKVEIPSGVMRGLPALKPGDTVEVTGFIRDGKFVVQALSLTKAKTK